MQEVIALRETIDLAKYTTNEKGYKHQHQQKNIANIRFEDWDLENQTL